MQVFNFRQLATRSALLLGLGLTVGSCEKAINVDPTTSISSDKGFVTKEDATAGLLGAYDAVQSGNYDGLAYPSMVGLIGQEMRHVGTFTTTYGAVGQNQVLPDNIQVGNTWNTIYDAIARANYVIQQTDRISDPAFVDKTKVIAEARALSAFHYMNLLALWGGTPQGYGYADGLGVPLRLVPITDIVAATTAIPRSSEAEVATAIRADLDFAIANLSGTTGSRITKSTAQALRARFELRMRNYADALSFAKLVPATSNFTGAAAELTGTNAPDAIWQLFFSTTDGNSYAFYWYPSSGGGRREFSPGSALAAAHPAGDKRLPINVVPATTVVTIAGVPYTLRANTTQKFYRVGTNDDFFNIVRYAEVVLTVAEAAAQTGDLTTALAQLNIIRVRAGLLPYSTGTPPPPTVPVTPAVAIYLAPTTADPTGQKRIVQDVLLQRRLELTYEAQYWFDLRRTNAVQSTLGSSNPATPNAWNQPFRNLFPIPNREVTLTNGWIAQNPGF